MVARYSLQENANLIIVVVFVCFGLIKLSTNFLNYKVDQVL